MTLHTVNRSFSVSFGVLRPVTETGYNSRTAFNVPNWNARSRPTALLSPSPDGKPETVTAVVVAPDDGHEDTRNMLSCI
jgi:hypothetical protein